MHVENALYKNISCLYNKSAFSEKPVYTEYIFLQKNTLKRYLCGKDTSTKESLLV